VGWWPKEKGKCTVSITSLGEVLSSKDLPWTHSLYLPIEGSWSLETPAMVVDDRYEEPSADQVSDFKYVLSIPDVQDIVENAKLQGKSSLEDFLQAFGFYMGNDAYIDFQS